MYDELSVSNIWPLMKQNAEFMQYFPDNFARGRLPAREYFFNVLNTIQYDYLQSLIKHAIEMRNSTKNAARA